MAYSFPVVNEVRADKICAVCFIVKLIYYLRAAFRKVTT